MIGTKKLLLETVEIDLGWSHDHLLTIYMDVHDNTLSRKWLAALNELLQEQYHLEKNYCFFGFADGPRNGNYLLEQINLSIGAINASDLSYRIHDHFDWENSVDQDGEIII